MDCLKQWTEEVQFSRQEELTFQDCDARGRMRLSTLLSFLAATAGHDFDARGLDYEKMYKTRQVFLLSRISLRIHVQSIVGDVLTITTWENGYKGAHVRRNYELTRPDGTVCVSAKSEWILVDPESRKILRPDIYTGRTITNHELEVDCPDCRKALLPREGLTEFGTRKIVYSDLDYNGHVYSGNYGDILWDALPEDLQNADLREFVINYNREATLGEELRLVGARDGNTLLAGGLCGEEHCFTCACVF